MKTISGSLQGWATPKQSTMAPATTPVLPRWTRWPTSGTSLWAKPSSKACGESIIARLGGENFPRIRIGIGAKPHPDYDLAAWVLGKFPPEDAKAIADRYADLEAAAKLIMDGKLGLAQSKYNG